jgi:hypothetical protein
VVGSINLLSNGLKFPARSTKKRTGLPAAMSTSVVRDAALFPIL